MAHEWQPIQTAPADTILILAWFETSLKPARWWYEVAEHHHDNTYPPGSGVNDGWKHPDATHWLPLPAPPFGQTK